MIEANEFFDPAGYPFEVLGFFEELIDCETRKLIGTRTVPAADRPIGSNGWKEFEITEPFEVLRGHRYVTVNASPKKPKRVAAMLQVKCGRAVESK